MRKIFLILLAFLIFSLSGAFTKDIQRNLKFARGHFGGKKIVLLASNQELDLEPAE